MEDRTHIDSRSAPVSAGRVVTGHAVSEPDRASLPGDQESNPSRRDGSLIWDRRCWVVLGACYVTVAFAFLWPEDFVIRSWWSSQLTRVSFITRCLVDYVGYAMVGVAAFAATRRRRWMLAASIPLLFFALGPTLWNFRPKTVPVVQGPNWTVMSVNLLQANGYAEPMREEILGVDPDVLIIQEYSDRWHEALWDTLQGRYPYHGMIRRNDAFGAALFSKLPFSEPIDCDVRLGTGAVSQMRAVIEFNGVEVVVYNVHFPPPKSAAYHDESRRMFADLVERMDKETRPILLSGDFNMTNRTPQAAALKAMDFTDAHESAGWGTGGTWPVLSFLRYVPSIAIDHIYLRGGLYCTDCRTGIGTGSDHRPIVARVGFALQE